MWARLRLEATAVDGGPYGTIFELLIGLLLLKALNVRLDEFTNW